MDKKYFFFDIDGTLIPGSGNRYVPENTRQALEQLRRKGHFLSLATGRARCMALEQMHALGFENMVSDGGYGVTLHGELLGIEPLEKEACIELAEECDRAGYAWGLSIEDDPVRLTKMPRFCEETDDKYQVARVVPDLDPAAQPQILKMYVSLPDGAETELPALKKLPWIRYGDMPYIFVEPEDKARGIRKIRDLCGCRDEDIVVFGDDLNDLSMFCPEWTCIAMGNAKPEIKERADFITKDCAEDGVGWALRHFGWI